MYKRVLIVNPFGIGDALFITPLIRAFHEQGAERIDLIVGKRTKELFETNPYVHDIFVFDREKIVSKSRWEQCKALFGFVKRLRQSRYDLLFDISFAWQYVALALLAGIRKRAGFNYKNRGRFHTDRIDLPQGYAKKHVVEYYMDLLGLLKVSAPSRELSVRLIDQDFQEAETLLAKSGISNRDSYIAMAPGGGESWGVFARLKRWPVEAFVEFAELMIKEGQIAFDKIILIGGSAERELAEQLVARNHNLFVNLCGKSNLRTSAAILKRASLLIANDGGLVHLAASMKVPVVALFGPVDPKVYGPYPPLPNRVAITNDGPECRPCYQNMRYNSSCTHIICLTELSPAHVIAQLNRVNFWKEVGSGATLS